VRKFEANINSTQRDFASKAAAYFKYASYDDQMVRLTSPLRISLTHNQCQSLEECLIRSKHGRVEMFSDGDVRYVSQYLGREYIVL
jgi:hypothetical protein